jgi:hypothetical protein
MADTLEEFGFVFPLDWKCEDLARAYPFIEITERQNEESYEEGDWFFWEEEDWDLFFNDRADALLKFLRVDEYPWGSGPTEIIYLCADPFSLPAAMVAARAFGLDTSDSNVSLVESLNAFGDIFKKLNLAFKLHGAILLGEPYIDSDYEYALYYFVDAMDYLTPALDRYYYTDIAPLNHNLLDCPVDEE